MRIIIVGAGIIGAALTDRLVHDDLAATSRVQVTVIDDRPPGSGTSGTSLAWLNANDPSDAAYHALRVAALQTWQELANGLGGPAWYRPVGNITWAVDTDARERLTADITICAAGWRSPALLATVGVPLALTDASQPHWLQRERPDEVNRLLTGWLASLPTA